MEIQTSAIASDGLIISSWNWLNVGDVMSNEVATICPDEIVISAAKIMSDKKISCLVVMDQGNVTGIITETDVLKRVGDKGKDIYRTKLDQIMSSPVESVPPDFSVLEASKIMGVKHIKRLPILKDEKLVGIVTQTDLVRALTSYGLWRDISEIMSRDIVGIQRDASVAEAAEIMTSRKISCIIVRDGDDVVGVLTEKDLLGRVVALQRDPANTRVQDVMSFPVTSVPPALSVFSASKAMEEMNIRRLVIMKDKRLCGVITQPDGKITYINPAFMELLKVAGPDELIGQPFLPERFWFDPEERNKFLQELQKRSIESRELILKSSKGDKLYVTVFPSYTKDIYGEINGSQAVVYDITAKKELVALRKAEEELAKLNNDLGVAVRELSHANKELQEFAHITAHDLKTPLRAIGTLADWLSKDYADKFDEQGKEKVRLLVTKAVQMSSLIDDILRYSRVGHDVVRKNPIPAGFSESAEQRRKIH